MDALKRSLKFKKRQDAIEYINKLTDDEIQDIKYIKNNYDKKKQKEYLENMLP